MKKNTLFLGAATMIIMSIVVQIDSLMSGGLILLWLGVALKGTKMIKNIITSTKWTTLRGF